MTGPTKSKRGDVVAVAGAGYAGKPRPCVVLQADEFDATDSVTVCLLSSVDASAPLMRIPITPSSENGLPKPTSAMADKVMTVRREHLGRRIGVLADADMTAIGRAIIVFLKLA